MRENRTCLSKVVSLFSTSKSKEVEAIGFRFASLRAAMIGGYEQMMHACMHAKDLEKKENQH